VLSRRDEATPSGNEQGFHPERASGSDQRFGSGVAVRVSHRPKPRIKDLAGLQELLQLVIQTIMRRNMPLPSDVGKVWPVGGLGNQSGADRTEHQVRLGADYAQPVGELFQNGRK